jgi:hypothetical protein
LDLDISPSKFLKFQRIWTQFTPPFSKHGLGVLTTQAPFCFPTPHTTQLCRAVFPGHVAASSAEKQHEILGVPRARASLSVLLPASSPASTRPPRLLPPGGRAGTSSCALPNVPGCTGSYGQGPGVEAVARARRRSITRTYAPDEVRSGTYPSLRLSSSPSVTMQHERRASSLYVTLGRPFRLFPAPLR